MYVTLGMENNNNNSGSNVNTILIVLVLVAVVAFGVWYFTRGRAVDNGSNNTPSLNIDLTGGGGTTGGGTTGSTTGGAIYP
ncbi:MAG: hypothetical protein KA052_02680 [Candidatus Pacebacteria bacterium]|nr:hypothetical protein [Candidatus Paceibacterota bacterium]